MGNLASLLIEKFEAGDYDDGLRKLYMDDDRLESERNRYIKAIKEYIGIFGDRQVEIYSAPGRSEIGGNHTDHQHGKVLAASINLDAIAVVSPNEDSVVNMHSEGYKPQKVDISNLEINEAEFDTTKGLIRGVAAGCAKRGFKIGGFDAYVTSEVMSGSGLSSSAAIEILLATIFSGLFNDGQIEPIVQAQIGQEAENQFFGKPSGLLDQMGCSVGNMVYIDFNDPKNPVVERIDVDFDSFGYSLCVVDTKGSHADLTNEYALVTKELGKVCEFFGKTVLREVSEDEFYKKMVEVRHFAGDRAVLRAIHIFDDNKRVEDQKAALLEGRFDDFCRLIKDCGNSSYRYLQNVYSTANPNEQSVAVALALTKKILGRDCACRNHGGGFAGTIEVFVPNIEVEIYSREIEKIFGDGSCHVLKIRPVGGTKVA